VSTASGIPDFRGPNGVWKRRRPVYFQEFLRPTRRGSNTGFQAEGWAATAMRANGVHEAIVALERAQKVIAVPV